VCIREKQINTVPRNARSGHGTATVDAPDAPWSRAGDLRS
jgi:hypothetical protein